MRPVPVLGVVWAAHTDVLRSVGDEFTLSTGVLALIALAFFLGIGGIIVVGYRYLYRSRGEER